MTVWLAGVLAASVVCFFIGALWYGVLFGAMAAELHPAYVGTGGPVLSIMALEFLRCLIAVSAFAYLLSRLGITEIPAAFVFAVIVWGGFQLTGLSGSVLHEGYPPKLFAIHMGDALVKALTACVVIVGITGRFG